MIDLDPDRDVSASVLANELMYPDAETHVAYRLGGRRVGAPGAVGRRDRQRLELPDDTPWLLGQDEGGSLDGLHVLDLPDRALGPREVRIAPEAAGLNFSDVLLALGLMPEGLLGDELCGARAGGRLGGY